MTGNRQRSHGKTRDGQRTYLRAKARLERRFGAAAGAPEDTHLWELVGEATRCWVAVAFAVLPNIDDTLEDADWLKGP